MEQREFPYTASGMYKLVKLLWKNLGKKASTHTLGDYTHDYSQKNSK